MASLGLAILSFLTGLFGPLGGVGGPSYYAAALFPISLFFSLLWLVVVLVAMIVIRWHGLWLLFGAPGALFWPAIILLLAGAITHCQAQHPGLIGGCVP
jgi:hypothetical protein